MDIAFIKNHVSERMVYFDDPVAGCHVAINVPGLIGWRSSGANRASFTYNANAKIHSRETLVPEL